MAIEQRTDSLRTDSMEAFYDELAGKHMDALWRGRVAGTGTNGEPVVPYAPYRWAWTDIRPFVDRAAQLVRPGPDAERRVIQLIHPELTALRAASHTLTANVQLVLPGEIAPSHRHTTGAIRFIMEGTAAITIVNGEPVSMSPGDLVLTPGWCWHGHINQSEGPVMWMDCLDRPITVALRQALQEPYSDELQPATTPLGDSTARYGAGHLRPMGTHATSPISPLFSYPWADTERSLHELARFSSDPFDDVAFDYTNPLTGGHVMPTIGCRIQMLRPGVHTQAHRHSSVSVYHVFRGCGSSIVDGVQIDWEQGDFLTIPPFAWHEHLNPSSDEAVLFSTTDAPVLEALCLYREDAYTKTGGHQEVKA
jgi:gentisate 1,2-dioxygenase